MGFVAVGAFVGGFVAAARGGNVIQGMALGAAGGYIGGAVAGGAGAGAGGEAAALGAGEVAGGLAAGEAGGLAAEALTAEAIGSAAGGAAEGALGAEVLSSAVPQAAATGELASAAAPAFESAAGSDLAAGTLEGGVSGAQGDIAGSVLTEGGVAAPAPPASVTDASAVNTGVNAPGAPWNAGAFDQAGAAGVYEPSLVNKALAWAKANPALASAVIQAGGSMIGGIGSGVGQYLSNEQKAELELKNKEALIQYYRDFVQTGSTGGKNVKLGLNAPAVPRPLRTTEGGLVRRAMTV